MGGHGRTRMRAGKSSDRQRLWSHPTKRATPSAGHLRRCIGKRHLPHVSTTLSINVSLGVLKQFRNMVNRFVILFPFFEMLTKHFTPALRLLSFLGGRLPFRQPTAGPRKQGADGVASTVEL